MSTSLSRVRWTEVEKIALAQATHAYLRIYPGARLMKAFSAGQEVLAENRRRKIQAKAEIAWIDDYLAKIKAAPDTDLFQSAAALDLEHQSNVISLPQRNQGEARPEAIPIPQLQTPPPSPALDLASIPLEELTKLWLSRFVQEHVMPNADKLIDDMISQKASAMLEQIQVMQGEKGRVQIVAPRYAQRHLKRKVLILGLLGNQVTVIKQKYDDALDLTLVTSDHNHDGLISLAKSHDIGIVMTRFVNHGQQDQIKRNSPHPVMISGAVSDLSHVLNSLVAEGKKGIEGHHFGKHQNGFQSQ